MLDIKMAAKKAMEMNAGETKKFVELYIRNECLWNPLSLVYSRRDFRLTATRNIILEMGNGMTEEQVAKKIACLRTCYARELKKFMDLQEKNSSDDEFAYRPRWQFFEMLDPYLRPSVLQNSSYFHNVDTPGTCKEELISSEHKRDVKDIEEPDASLTCSGYLESNGTVVHVNSTCPGNLENNGLTINPVYGGAQENYSTNNINPACSTNLEINNDSTTVSMDFRDCENNSAVITTKCSSNPDMNGTVSACSRNQNNNYDKDMNTACTRVTETNHVAAMSSSSSRSVRGKRDSFASTEKRNTRVLDMRKRKADNLESTMLDVLTRLEKRLSGRADEREVETSVKHNSDDIFAQHLANLMRRVPEGKHKWEMQLKLQQTVMEYIPD